MGRFLLGCPGSSGEAEDVGAGARGARWVAHHIGRRDRWEPAVSPPHRDFFFFPPNFFVMVGLKKNLKEWSVKFFSNFDDDDDDFVYYRKPTRTHACVCFCVCPRVMIPRAADGTRLSSGMSANTDSIPFNSSSVRLSRTCIQCRPCGWLRASPWWLPWPPSPPTPGPPPTTASK